MRTHAKTLTLCMAALALAAAATAREQPPREKPDRKPDGFQCHVCGSPCISRAQLQRQMKARGFSDRPGRQYRAERSAYGRHQHEMHYPGQRAARTEQSRQSKQRSMRFDIDGDGQLSQAEKAARRAYREAS